MTPHGLDAIIEVSRFLEQDIVPSVPAEFKSELKAAIKILQSAATELNVSSPMLRQECTELLALNEESSACAALPTTVASNTAMHARLADSALDLRGLFALHQDVLAASNTHMTGLLELSASVGSDRERSRALLLRYYQLLEQHAVRRLPWQSVFSGPLGDNTR